MPELTVGKFYEERKDLFDFTLLNSNAGLKKLITNAEMHRPGLALTGFFERFPNQRILILGETEMTYLNQLSHDVLEELTRPRQFLRT